MCELDLIYLPRNVKIFSMPVSALEHVCDHVLTQPETWYWTLYIPSYRNWIQLEQDRYDLQRSQFARDLWADQMPEAAQHLYEEYAKEIQRSLTEAEHSNWFWKELDVEKQTMCQRGLGLSGVMITWTTRYILTAFFPDQNGGNAGVPDRDLVRRVADRKHNPLPRETSYLTKRVPADTPRVRFDIFFESVHAVRRKFATAYIRRSLRITLPSAGAETWFRGVPRLSFAEWERRWNMAGRSPLV